MGGRNSRLPPWSPLENGFAPVLSKVDLHGAYYQLGFKDPSENAVGLYNPEEDQW